MKPSSDADLSLGSLATSTRTIGRYVMSEPIAAGGMATVHLGRMLGSVGFAKSVAIKRVKANLATEREFVQMLIDEARVASRIRHANVVATLDLVEEDDELLLVMEYIHGESLARLRRSARDLGEPIPAPIAMGIMAGLLNGLHAAHEACDDHGEPLGVVHRDVSPQNVLVGVDGIPRLADFGIAKAFGRLQETQVGDVKGKPAYMTPEQVRGEPVSRQTDIFAAGIVMWETLTGRRLFVGRDAEVFAQILNMEIPPPSSLNEGLNPAVDAVVLRALCRVPAERFATARDMAQEALRVLPAADAPTLGHWVERTAKAALRARSGQLQALESGSVSLTPPPMTRARVSSPSSRVLAVEPVEVTMTRVPATATTGRVNVVPPEKNAQRVLFAALLIAFPLCAAVLFSQRLARHGGRFGMWGSTSDVGASHTSAGGGGVSTAAEVLSEPDAAVTGAPSLSAVKSPATLASSVASGPNAVRLRPPSARPLRPPVATPSANALKTTDCDIPYEVDATGERKYKRQCFE